MQVIQAGPSRQTLRQAAFQDSMNQVFDGMRGMEQDARTKRQEALALQGEALKLREAGYDVTPEMLAKNLEDEPNGLAKLFGAKSPEKADLYTKVDAEGKRVRNSTSEWMEKQKRDAEDRTFKRKINAADYNLKLARTDEAAAKAKESGLPYWETKEGRVAKEKSIDDIRKEISGLPATKAMVDIDASLAKINSAAEDAPGDMSLIFNYMKMLDPGSTVREGEYANAEQARGVDSNVLALYNKAKSGQKLTPEQRSQFKSGASKLASSQYETYNSFTEPQRKRAKELGLDESMIVPSFSQKHLFSGKDKRMVGVGGVGNQATANDIAVIKSPERTIVRQSRISELKAKQGAN